MRVVVRASGDRHKQLVVFDPDDSNEVAARCAMFFTASLKCPIALFYGDKDWDESIQKQFVALAKHFQKDAALTIVRGNHGESLPNAIPGIIEKFTAYQPAKAK